LHLVRNEGKKGKEEGKLGRLNGAFQQSVY
jgi:hypothetical protein